jgi:hypothetical protein
MNEKLKRRWLSFSLRTLLIVVAVVSVWLGIQVKWRRGRERAMTDYRPRFYNIGLSVVTAPWSIRLLGEPAGPYDLGIAVRTPEERQFAEEFKKLFPERRIQIKED